MAKNEVSLDFYINDLLKDAGLDPEYQGSSNVEIHAALKSASKNLTGRVGRPEYIAFSKDYLLVVENKKDLEKLELIEDSEIELSPESIKNYAVNGAYHYAKHILNNTSYKKIFFFGNAGDSKHHVIQPYFLDESGYTKLPEVQTFENFSPANIDSYYHEQVLGEESKEEVELANVLKFASDLHEQLRNYGNLSEKDKPLVVSGILLALREKEKGNFSLTGLTGNTTKTDGQKIYEAIETNLRDSEIPETKRDILLTRFSFIRNNSTLNHINSVLKKTPLRYFTERIDGSLYSLITQNTPEDYLGRFYGEFISYTGGDGQNLGIVLTPRHITELMNDLVGTEPEDIIFDPCCGTGGFLISAMSRMLNEADSEEKREEIKKNQIHGIEMNEEMFTIASTNMILRGDGKSNLIYDDFLAYPLADLQEKEFTVGLMNPPYSLAKKKETEHLSEIKFIHRLLSSMKKGARVAVIVPQSTMVGKRKSDRETKELIFKKHTLEGVITLNPETFYRVGVNPVIAVFTAGVPHNKRKLVKFINFKDDGYSVSKHRGLVKTERAKDRKKYLLDAWRGYKRGLPTSFMVESTVEHSDEWLHSFYYFNDEIPSEKDFIKTIGDYLTFEFSMIAQGRGYLFEDDDA